MLFWKPIHSSGLRVQTASIQWLDRWPSFICESRLIGRSCGCASRIFPSHYPVSRLYLLIRCSCGLFDRRRRSVFLLLLFKRWSLTTQWFIIWKFNFSRRWWRICTFSGAMKISILIDSPINLLLSSDINAWPHYLVRFSYKSSFQRRIIACQISLIWNNSRNIFCCWLHKQFLMLNRWLMLFHYAHVVSLRLFLLIGPFWFYLRTLVLCFPDRT